VNWTVHYKKDGKLHTHRRRIGLDTKKKASIDKAGVAGSVFIKDRTNPNAKPYTGPTARHLQHLRTSVLDAGVPVPISKDDAQTPSERNAKIPPLMSKGWVILESRAGEGSEAWSP